MKLPLTGKAFISVTNSDKGQAVILARRLNKLGFDLVATYGTAKRLHEVGLECEIVFKVNEGRPNIADLIRQGDIALIINTPLGKTSHYDEKAIRKAALQFNVPCVTTITGAEALVEAIATKKIAERRDREEPAGDPFEKRIGGRTDKLRNGGKAAIRAELRSMRLRRHDERKGSGFPKETKNSGGYASKREA